MPSFTSDGTSATPSMPKFVGSGGGSFPKAVDLFGALVMLTPVLIEKVPGFNGRGMTDRLTADTVVLDGDHSGSYPSMWWGQSPIVKAGADALRHNDGRVILGRMFRFPQNANKAQYPNREALEAALASWRPGQPEIGYAWALEPFTPQDQAIAEAYLRGEHKLGQSSNTIPIGQDPFGD